MMRKLLKLLVIPFIIAISLCIIFALQADRRVANMRSMTIRECKCYWMRKYMLCNFAH